MFGYDVFWLGSCSHTRAFDQFARVFHNVQEKHRSDRLSHSHPARMIYG